MGLFTWFQNAFVSTVLVGEPMVVIFLCIAYQLAYTRVLDDHVFAIFLGSLCATLFAKQLEWKPIGDHLGWNILKAAFILFVTQDILHYFLPWNILIIIGINGVFYKSTGQWMIPVFLFVLELICVLHGSEYNLAVLTMATFLLGVFFYVGNKLKWV